MGDSVGSESSTLLMSLQISTADDLMGKVGQGGFLPIAHVTTNLNC